MGLWEAKYWLPREVKWNDISNRTAEDGYMFPSVSHLGTSLCLGILLTLARVAFDRAIFVPLAFYFEKKVPSTRQQLMEREKKYKRMAESFNHVVCYVLTFTTGLYMLSHQTHFYDLKECWRNWPFHPVPINVAWYYLFQAGFYISLSFSMICFDTVRSDFWQMISHHFITLLLICSSWSMNMVRVGTLVLVSHDAVDILIDVAKIFRYGGHDSALFYTFILVLIIWIVTRLVYYPFWILNSVWFDAPTLIQSDYSWLNVTQLPIAPRMIMILLSLLLILHVFWTYILLKVVYESMNDGVLDDVREDFDESSKVRKKAKDTKSE